MLVYQMLLLAVMPMAHWLSRLRRGRGRQSVILFGLASLWLAARSDFSLSVARWQPAFGVPRFLLSSIGTAFLSSFSAQGH